MNTKNKFVISNDSYRELCAMVFKILNCNALWIMKLGADSLNVLVTDHCILTHYLDKKYYLQDTTFDIKPNNDDESCWKITLGTDSEAFNKNGFLHDLYKMFNIEEYVSIEKKSESEHYCFRFFTKNNRFSFMNQLIMNMPIIKMFINSMIEKCQQELHDEKYSIRLADLKGH